MTPLVPIGIALNNGNEFGIDTEGDMFIGRIAEPASRIYLGPASAKQFQQIVENMKRLKILMEEEA